MKFLFINLLQTFIFNIIEKYFKYIYILFLIFLNNFKINKYLYNYEKIILYISY